MEKRKAAWLLYKEGMSQKEISEVLKTHVVTISNWAIEEAWKERRDRLQGINESLEEGMLELIAYQQDVLRLKKDEWSLDIQLVKTGAKRADELKLLPKGEIDALQKMYASIRGKPKEWSNYVSIMKEFLEYVSEEDNAVAISLASYSQRFLQGIRSEL